VVWEGWRREASPYPDQGSMAVDCDRLKWAETGPTWYASERTAVRATAAVPLGARNRAHRPKRSSKHHFIRAIAQAGRASTTHQIRGGEFAMSAALRPGREPDQECIFSNRSTCARSPDQTVTGLSGRSLCGHLQNCRAHNLLRCLRQLDQSLLYLSVAPIGLGRRRERRGESILDGCKLIVGCFAILT
jgi:hypothetical protein